MATITITIIDSGPNEVTVHMGGDQPHMPTDVEDFTLAQLLGTHALVHIRELSSDPQIKGTLQ